VVRTDFPSVKNCWHHTYVDFEDIVLGKLLKPGLHEVTCAQLDTVAMAKFARFEWEIQYMMNETRAYEWIEGKGIGPRFLGHLTEGSRVIGFLLERVTDARYADSTDLAACERSLQGLHQLGILHGDVNRFNFLIKGSEAVLIDFDTARKCEDSEALCRKSKLCQPLWRMSLGGKGCKILRR
jgi:predicted Ser/Thr protein kinase